MTIEIQLDEVAMRAAAREYNASLLGNHYGATERIVRAYLDTIPTVTSSETIAAVIAERNRQIAAGYDAEHDDQHKDGEIIMAPWGALERIGKAFDAENKGDIKGYMDELVRVAALVVSEIDRVKRATKKDSTHEA